MTQTTSPHRERGGLFSLISRINSESMVAPDPLTDRTLIAVIVIMTFIAALTAGLVLFASAATARWQATLSSELTVQVRPQPGRIIDNDLARAADLLKGTPGITKVKIYSYEDTVRLLEPWLGPVSSLGALPIPRLIAVELNGESPPDLTALSHTLAREVSGAVLDDHRTWTRRLSRLGNSLVIGSALGLMLIMAATALAIVFATRGAMVGNRDIVEVFYFMGADDRYIARVFQRHFFKLGLRGGILGSSLALLALLALRLVIAGSEGLRDVFGLSAVDHLSSIGLAIIIAAGAVALFVAFLAGVASRLTVHSTLGRMV